jgi:hypothetical protein
VSRLDLPRPSSQYRNVHLSHFENGRNVHNHSREYAHHQNGKASDRLRVLPRVSKGLGARGQEVA